MLTASELKSLRDSIQTGDAYFREYFAQFKG